MRWFAASCFSLRVKKSIAFALVCAVASVALAQTPQTQSLWQRATAWWDAEWNAPENAEDRAPRHARVRNITQRERDLAQGTTSAMDAPEHHLRAAGTELSDATPPGQQPRGETQGGGFRPDRQTELNADVAYHETFDPAISPWKRLVALERIALDDDGVPVIVKPETPNLRDVPLSSGPGVGSEVFVGHVTLDFSTSHTIALPSIAPHAELFSVRSSVDVPLQIVRDQSDNFFVVYQPRFGRAEDVPPFAITFGMSAPRDYFGGGVPDVRVNALEGRVLPVPNTVARDGLIFANELGLSRRSTFREALEILTAHFRSFQESREPPPDTGNIYLDLARGRRGICRHRAYAFVLTAAALGMHARFVHNEAHAWVEVEVPVASNYPRQTRWLRVDLGGAAATPRVTGLEHARSVHRPEMADALPSPSNYSTARTALLSGTNRAGGNAPVDPTGAGNAADPQPSAPFSATPQARQDSVRTQASTNENAHLEDATTTTTTASVLAVVDTFPGQVQRGLEIELRGQVGHRGTCAIWVFAQRENGPPIRLGQALSHDGVFVLHAGVPAALGVGEYRLVPEVVRCDG